MAENLFELVARVEADFRPSDRAIDQNERKVQRLVTQYRQLDRETKTVSGSHGRFSSVLGGLGDGANRLGGPLGNLTNRVSGLTTTFTGGTAAAGPYGIALGAIAALTVGAAAGVTSLTISTTNAIEKFNDMSLSLGISVPVLSTLGNLAEHVGGSVDGISSSLFLFETKMGEARDTTSEMSKIFKILGIDTHNVEVATQQAFDALLKLNNAEVQATIGKKLFGRSVKDLLTSLREAGSFNAYLNDQIIRGLVPTAEMSRRAAVLGQKLTDVQQQFRAVGHAVGSEFSPIVLSALQSFSRWLQDNQAEIKSTAREVAKLIGDITSLASLIYSISPLRLTVEIIRKVITVAEDMQGGGGPRYGDQGTQRGLGSQSLFDRFWQMMDRGPRPGAASGAFGPATGDPYATQAQRDAAVKKYNEDQKKATESAKKAAAEQKRLQDQIDRLLSGAGKGGKGGGKAYDPTADIKRLADLQLQTTIETLRREESDIQRSFDKRRLTITVFQRASTRLEEERHKAVLDNLKAEQDAIEKNPKLNQLQKSVALTEIELQRAREVNRHRERESELQEKINRQTRERIALTETLIGLMRRGRFSSDVILEELGGGSVQVNEDTREGTTRERRIADRTRPRIATEAEQRRREDFAAHIQRLRDLAADITFTIDDAIRSGFERGIGAGIAAFGLGILEMARHQALRELEKAIAKALIGGDEANRTGGGSWLGRILGMVIGAVGGSVVPSVGTSAPGFAGGTLGGAIGGKAEGGFVRPYEWSWVGERGPELMRAGYAGASVMSNEDSARGTVINNYWKVVTPDYQSFVRRDSDTQIRNKMKRAMRAA